MKLINKNIGTVAGIAGAALVCLPCCLSIPLATPLLGWLGLSTAGAAISGWYVGAASVFVLGAGAWLLLRRVMARRTASTGCGGAGTCKAVR